MTDSSIINPLKSKDTDFFTDNLSTKILNEIKEIKSKCIYTFVLIAMLVCTNIYTLTLCLKISKNVIGIETVGTNYIMEYINPKPDSEIVYDVMPDLNTANSKQVVNLLDFQNMDDEIKDNIFNNIDSIVVTDGDEGTSRHQISKVNWIFDDADTMLLYTVLGEVFALASNGTISTYNTVNGARRLLESNLGWLEGKIPDIIHHGSEYKNMIQRGKDYMKTRQKIKEISELAKDFVDVNEQIIKAEETGESTIELTKQLEVIKEQKEIVQIEKNLIPVVIQKPIEEQSLDMFMQQQEIEKLEKEFDQTKAEEVVKYRDEITEEKQEAIRIVQEEKQEAIRVVQEEIRVVKEDRYETIRELNETKFIKSEEMDAIKYELDITKSEIEEVQDAINRFIEREDNVTKIEQMTDVMNSLQDTKGKITFTQVQISEDEVSLYDSRPIDMRSHRSDEEHYYEREEYTDLHEHEQELNHEREEYTDLHEHEQDTWEEPTWTEEIIEDITKSCSIVKGENICVCSNKVTREVHKC